MAHDSDVARVAAALNSPGLRYRNFNNHPVRVSVQPVTHGANSSPLPATASETASEAVAATIPHAGDQSGDQSGDQAGLQPEAGPALRLQGEWPAISAAMPPGRSAQPAGLGESPFGFAGLASPVADAGGLDGQGGFLGTGAALPAPGVYPAPLGDLGFGGSPAAFGRTPAEPVRNGYRLLESLGFQGGMPGGPAAPSDPWATYPNHGSAGGTFASLMAQDQPATTTQGSGRPPPSVHPAEPGPPTFGPVGFPPAGFPLGGLPPAAPPSGHWPGPRPSSAYLPAAMVTLPLAEVMRLVAVGAPVASFPLAAFRVSGSASHSR